MLDEVSQFFEDVKNGKIYDEVSGEYYDLTRMGQREVVYLFKEWKEKRAECL
tara:strand:+ start:3240 stop:3395 length:156 start_codon:yes stop_codon:yes gene_type:complete